MRWKTTLWLLLLVLILGGIIIGVERFLPSTRELLEMKRGPIKFEPASITQVDIDSSGGDGVSFSLDSGQWWVRRPYNDLADPEKVAKLLKDLTEIGWIQRIHRTEFADAGAWARTSLEQPLHKIRLRSGGEQVLECWIGAASPIEGSRYIAILPKKPGGEVVHYVAKTPVADLLRMGPKNWRDPKLLRLPANHIVKLRLSQPSGEISLERANEKASWRFTKPLSTRGSKERINEIISTILNLEIKDAAEPANGGDRAQSAGAEGDLAASQLKIAISVAGQEATPYEIVLNRPAKASAETSATASHRKPVFTVTSKSINDLWAQPNDLRDRMLARIDEDAVTQIRITGDGYPPVELSKEANSWFLQRHGRLEAANGDRISRFFDALNTFKILDYTSDSASNLALYGLQTPILTASWQEESAKPVTLLIGKNAQDTEFFAKYEDEPSVYRVDASLLPSIPPDNIKWKGLGALRFTQFALRRISLAAGTAPPVILNYDPTTAQWSGSMAGRDVTALIDRVKADKLAGILAKFNVQDWATDRSDALTALKNPALRVVVTLGEPGTNTGPTHDIVLNFSPTQAGSDTAFYFGQIEGDPDVFYVTRSALLEMAAKVFKDG